MANNSLTGKEFDPSVLPAEFCKLYGGEPSSVSLFASPARINIIGEHIDYNGGKVFPAAINKYLYLAIRKRADDKIIYNDLRFPGTFEFSINDRFAYKKEDDYANYLNGILSIISRKGYKLDTGFEVLMCSNLPAGGGISSSSALECGFAYAISELYGFNISRIDIAKIGQQSEHEFMNVQCGIMDQFIIATAKENTAEVLDCASLEYEYVPLILGDYRFIVMNTNKKRKLSDSKYNERRAECEKGLSILNENGAQLKNLCELSLAKFEELKGKLTDAVIQKRVKHVVTENARVGEAVDALKAGDLKKLGALLNASHESLKNDYEVSGIELDTLAETAQAQEGCIGARMTGAGFGGCAIALVHKDKADSFIEAVDKIYAEKIGYSAGFFSCSSGNGVARLAF